MDEYLVHRKDKGDCVVVILFDRYTEKYAFVNLTTCHICKCRFDTIEDALKDMDERDDVISYEKIIHFKFKNK